MKHDTPCFKPNSTIMLFIILIVADLSLFIGVQYMFPSHGGFSRQILFIHADDENDISGYTIILDELSPAAQKFQIDFVLHGRGDLVISPDQRSATFSTESYLSHDIISVNASFLSPINRISSHEGNFYPIFNPETPDATTPYIKANYDGRSNPVMGTVLYPRNTTDSQQAIPRIKFVGENSLGQIGEDDLIYYQPDRHGVSFETPIDIYCDAKVLFMRKNAQNYLMYAFLDDVTELTYNSYQILKSSLPLDNIMAKNPLSTTNISGTINLKEPVETPVQVQFYSTFLPEMVLIAGSEIPFTYSNNIVTISVSQSCSFSILGDASISTQVQPGSNPLLKPISEPKEPEKSNWEINAQNLDDLHPYIILNQTEIDDLRAKIISNQEPWNSWYSEYIGWVDDIVSTPLSEINQDGRQDRVRRLTMKYIIEGGDQYLNKIRDYLLDMPNMDPLYEKDLRRAYALQGYSIALDLVYNDLDAENRSQIEMYLSQHAQPLLNMEIYSDNNHRVVDAAGLGMAGLVLKDDEYINTATDSIMSYLYEKPRADGGSYEGQSYLAFAFHQSLEFMEGLQRIGGYNFFSDSKYIACLKFMAESITPLGTLPFFEDTYLSGDTPEVLLLNAPRLDRTQISADYEKYFQFLFESRQNNSALPNFSDYYYLEGKDPDFRRLAMYNPPTPITASIPNFNTSIYSATNMAFFRDGYRDNPKESIYLAISCKNYLQSHPHYDENSFELWAYGAWLIHNPGYPNFGKPGHDYAIDSEGSNTLLINGRGQLAPYATGFQSAIVSTDLDMVVSDASEAYNSPGSFHSQPPIHLALIFIFLLLLSSGILYAMKFRYPNSKLQLDQESKSIATGRKSDTSFYSKPTASNLQKWGKRSSWIIAGPIAIANAIYFSLISLRFDKYMAYSDNPLKIVIPFKGALYSGLIIVPTLIVIFAYFRTMKQFSKLTTRILAGFSAVSPDETKVKVYECAKHSILWEISVLIPSLGLIGFTTIRDFIKFEDVFFQSVGGVGEAVYYLIEWLADYLIIMGIVLIIHIPMAWVSIRYFSRSLGMKTCYPAVQKRVRIAALIAIILRLVIHLLLFLTIILPLLFGASLIGIEML